MRTISGQYFNKNKEIKKFFTITFFWVFIQAVFYVYEYYSTLDLIHTEKLMGTFEFWPNFINTLRLSLLGGVIGGTIVVSKIPADKV